MMTVVLACAILGSWTPPTDWTVVEVIPAYSIPWSEYTESQSHPTIVKLRREMKVGEVVQPPAGCLAEGDARASRSGGNITIPSIPWPR